MNNSQKFHIGIAGEYYLLYELAKLGVLANHVGRLKEAGGTDVILPNGDRIEVKSSVYTKGRFKSTFNPSIKVGGWIFGDYTLTARSGFVLINV